MSSKHIQFRSDSRLEEHFPPSASSFVRKESPNPYNNFVIPVYRNTNNSRNAAVDGWKQSSDRLAASRTLSMPTSGTISSESIDTLHSGIRANDIYTFYEPAVRIRTNIDSVQGRQKSIPNVEQIHRRQQIIKESTMSSNKLKIVDRYNDVHSHTISMESLPFVVDQNKEYVNLGPDRMTTSRHKSVYYSPRGSFHSENDLHRKGMVRNQFLTSSLRNESSRGQLYSLSRRQLHRSMSDIGYGKLESYKKLEVIGEGTYATVYKGYSNLLKRLVALKEIKMEKTEGAPCTAIREISILRSLRHANIVTLHDIIFTDNSLTLVFEFAGLDLRRFMKQNRYHLQMSTIRLFLLQILRALAFCHAKQIVHRDLKPQNLLINEKKEVKLADFGLARAQSIPTKTYSTEVATLWYRPPDVLLGDRTYTGDIDIWGAGCILYEMVTGHSLFPGKSQEDQIWIIFKKIGTPPEQYWPGLRRIEAFRKAMHENSNAEHIVSSEDLSVNEFLDRMRLTLTSLAIRLDSAGIELLARCLEPLGSRRITAAQALSHYFFDGILPLGTRIEELSPLISLVNLVNSDETSRSLSQSGLRQQLIGVRGTKADTHLTRARLQPASVDDVRINPANKEHPLQPHLKDRLLQITATKPIQENQFERYAQEASSSLSTSPPRTFAVTVGLDTNRDTSFQPTGILTNTSPHREMRGRSRGAKMFIPTSKAVNARATTLPFVVESNRYAKFQSSPRPSHSGRRLQPDAYGGKYYNSLDRQFGRAGLHTIALREALVPHSFKLDVNHQKGQQDSQSPIYDSFSYRNLEPQYIKSNSFKKDDYPSTYQKYNSLPANDVSQFKPRASIRKTNPSQTPLRVFHNEKMADEVSAESSVNQFMSSPDRTISFSSETSRNRNERIPKVYGNRNSVDCRESPFNGFDNQYATRFPMHNAIDARGRLTRITTPPKVILVKQSF